LHYPMATLLIVIRDFFDETHKLGEIIKVGKERIDLVNRCLDDYRGVMFCHTVPPSLLFQYPQAGRERMVASAAFSQERLSLKLDEV
jgi:hypothetical protein